MQRTVLDFFAGSGLVSFALSPWFKTIWANDVSEDKYRVFAANLSGIPFFLGSVEDVRGEDVPPADLSWGSFPCQDLSLAGKAEGLAGTRSGLFRQWIRVMREMPDRPPVAVAENVTGLLSADETAALMGAPGFRLPGSYNDAYMAMGDGVAVPVAAWLADHLLAPLCGLARTRRPQ